MNKKEVLAAIGDGINRIHDAVKDHPLKPKMPTFNDVGGTVIATLFGADLNKVEKTEIKPRPNDRQRKAVGVCPRKRENNQ